MSPSTVLYIRRGDALYSSNFSFTHHLVHHQPIYQQHIHQQHISQSTIIPIITMQISALLTVAFAAVVSAKCHNSGESWTNRDQVLNFAREICNTSAIGTYQPGTGKGWCLNVASDKKANIEIINYSSAPEQLKSDNCFEKLAAEINGCPQGGRTFYSKFEFGYVMMPLFIALSLQSAVAYLFSPFLAPTPTPDSVRSVIIWYRRHGDSTWWKHDD